MPAPYPSREQTFLKAIAQSKELPPQKLFEVSSKYYSLYKCVAEILTHPLVSPNHVQKIEIVGKGAYGAVYKGRHIASSQIVALKIINLDTADDDVADIQKEVSLLQQLMTQGQKENKDGSPSGSYGVPNVIKYYGSWLEGPRVWIIMEYAEGGSVRTLVSSLPFTQ
jgi:serine/threonine protein kinase